MRPPSRMDAFDADVLIYAAQVDHPMGAVIRRLFASAAERDPESPPQEAAETALPAAGIGSVLLLPETLTKPHRTQSRDELAALAALLSRLDLRPVDEHTALAATSLGAAYGLRAADAVHLATAVVAGADRFITNNRRDFPASIAEVAITYPADLVHEPGPHDDV